VVREPGYVKAPPGTWRALYDSPDYALYRVLR